MGQLQCLGWPLAVLLLLGVIPQSAAAADVSEAKLQESVFRVRSGSERGTAFVFMTEGRHLYLLTALHVLGGGKIPGGTPCILDRGTPEVSVECKVIHTYDRNDVAVISADVTDYPGTFTPWPLGSSLTMDPSAKLITYGYPRGGGLERDEGIYRGARQQDLIIKSIVPVEGQSGSPLFDASTHQVVGIILNRELNGTDQQALMIESVKLLLCREILFRQMVGFNILPAEMQGPLTASDTGMSLKNLFDSVSSPLRWYTRSRHYQRSDGEGPWLGDNNGWLGFHRTYSSSRSGADNALGYGWVHEYQYNVDVESSTLCTFTVINQHGLRETFHLLQDCAAVKGSLAAQVDDPKLLDGSLASLLSNDHLMTDVLPISGPSYVGADLQVSRAHFVSRGIEIVIGGTRYTFNSYGRLVHLRTGRFDVDMQYDAKGRLVLASDPRRSMQLDYEQSHMSALTFSDGTMYSYKYTNAGDLSQVSMNGDVVEEYEYDARHKLIHVARPKEPDLERKITYDDAGLRRAVLMADHTESHWDFSEADDKSIVERTYGERDSSESFAPDHKERFVFNLGDDSLEMYSGDEVKIYHLTICLCFPLDVQKFDLTSSPGGALQRVLPGKLTAYKYDPFGRLILQNEHGNMMRYSYDDRSNKVSQVETSTDGGKWFTKARYSYNDQANLSATDVGNEHITLKYDEFGRISSLKHNDLGLTFTYNRRDKPIVIALDSGDAVSFTYKENGEVDKINSQGSGGNVATTIMRALQDLTEATEPAGAHLDTDYSHVEWVNGDRKCSCTLE